MKLTVTANVADHLCYVQHSVVAPCCKVHPVNFGQVLAYHISPPSCSKVTSVLQQKGVVAKQPNSPTNVTPCTLTLSASKRTASMSIHYIVKVNNLQPY